MNNWIWCSPSLSITDWHQSMYVHAQAGAWSFVSKLIVKWNRANIISQLFTMFTAQRAAYDYALWLWMTKRGVTSWWADDVMHGLSESEAKGWQDLDFREVDAFPKSKCNTTDDVLSDAIVISSRNTNDYVIASDCVVTSLLTTHDVLSDAVVTLLSFRHGHRQRRLGDYVVTSQLWLLFKSQKSTNFESLFTMMTGSATHNINRCRSHAFWFW
jgi:hypothetical protein